MTSEVRRAKKDVLADLVSVKYDVMTCISSSSMRKAVLVASEDDVRSDMEMVVGKLYTLLKAVHENAKYELTQESKVVREKVNDEIIFLEELHKSLDDMETYVKENASTTNMRPIKMGKDKCDDARASIEQFKANVKTSCVKFVLHQLLAGILEQIETFALGKMLVMDAEHQIGMAETIHEEPDFINDDFGDDDVIIRPPRREPSQDPIRTSFIRSSSSKLIKLPERNVQESPRQPPQLPRNSTLSNKGGHSGLSRQNSNVNLQLGNAKMPSRRNSRTDMSVTAMSRQNSVTESTAGSLVSPRVEKPSKLIPKRKRNVSMDSKLNGSNSEEPEYRTIAGLRATIAQRSSSAPLINLPSTSKSDFMSSIPEEKSIFQIENNETLTTKMHATGCYITGVAVLQNGSVVLCDNMHDSLQLYDSQLQPVAEMECAHPWGVTSVSEAAVAVSLHYEHKLILVKTQQGLEKIVDKDIVLKCKASLTYDVKFYSYRLYVLCFDGDIHVVDLKGREYKVIKTDMGLNSARYFDIDVDNDILVIAGQKGVTCTSKGLPMWNFKTRIGKAKIVCTGVLLHKEHVLVCDWENFRIAEIHDDGQKMRTVHGEGLERPVALCLAPAGDALYVTQGDYDMDPEKTRTVRVLKMQTVED
ncbi:hypothetical protein MAR_021415 [Mya arenaria]|uniref:Uncharacterized protein n=1 Tax=Mya arenaria TaxID=6604 RepID=A0ABY7EBK0_MYAAR|nr:uncharacterized protein LOC128234187 [Mya arenaria]WAR06046.1 hypothetical protein MAR_021415 [Mya arenaria]